MPRSRTHRDYQPREALIVSAPPNKPPTVVTALCFLPALLVVGLCVRNHNVARRNGFSSRIQSIEEVPVVAGDQFCLVRPIDDAPRIDRICRRLG